MGRVLSNPIRYALRLAKRAGLLLSGNFCDRIRPAGKWLHGGL